MMEKIMTPKRDRSSHPLCWHSLGVAYAQFSERFPNSSFLLRFQIPLHEKLLLASKKQNEGRNPKVITAGGVQKVILHSAEHMCSKELHSVYGSLCISIPIAISSVSWTCMQSTFAESSSKDFSPRGVKGSSA